MKINSIRLKNFRGFEDKTFEFNDHFNVVIGNNATGKTALLDALALSMSSFFLGIDGYYSKNIHRQDIRLRTFTENLEPQFPVEVEAKGEIDGTSITWLRDLQTERGTTRKSVDTKILEEIAKSKQTQVRDGAAIDLPILAYYGTGRLWKEKKATVKTKPKSSRFDGYIHATESYSNSRTFIQWMKTQEIAVLQKKKIPTYLTVVKGSIGIFLEQSSRVFFDIENDTLCLEYLDKESRISHLYWDMLSDGYRNVIAMAADLAYRCVILNPHHEEWAAERAEGIVLIDELDLHLHPKWQRTIVDCFKRAFPKLQFITTTHSPFIVQSLKNEELIDLETQNVDKDYYKMGIEEIVEKEMKVDNPIRSEKYRRMLDAAERYYTILNQFKYGDIPKNIQSQLEDIELQFSSEPAYVALLKSERKAKLH